MKTSISFVVGIALGAVAASAWAFTTPDSAPAAVAESKTTDALRPAQEAPAALSSPVTLAEARAMFRAYHQSADLASSKGPLKLGDGRAIEMVLVEYADIIEPLKEAVEKENKTFYGVCAIPAKNPQSGDHSFLWMGVVQEGSTTGANLELFIPADTSNQPDYIYDHNDVCPPDCPRHHDILW